MVYGSLGSRLCFDVRGSVGCRLGCCLGVGEGLMYTHLSRLTVLFRRSEP